MGFLEVILLLAGAVLAVLSFVLPAAKEETDRETRGLVKEEIKTMVDAEIGSIRQHVDDVVDEAVGYAVEKTERSLERLTNEKIMAVNEYSDTVLQEIHKNHEEAMFLYDMLNAKHESLKEVVTETTKAVQEAQDAIEKLDVAQAELEVVHNNLGQSVETKQTEMQQTAIPQTGIQLTGLQRISMRGENFSETKTPEIKIPQFERIEAPSVRQTAEPEVAKESLKEWDFMTDDKGSGTNKNERILMLHKQGKSTVAIAKELGLGVGEVKLVIDLYKNS